MTLLQTTTSNQYQQHPKGAPTGKGRKKITTVREVKEEEGKKKNHDGTRSGGRRRKEEERKRRMNNDSYGQVTLFFIGKR